MSSTGLESSEPAEAGDRPTLWEWHAELEHLVYPVERRGEPAHRIRYRWQGERKWSSFLLSSGNMAAPTETMILRAIEEHAASC